jgi:uncharacterized protein YndB with AHSA1/START domain
MDTDRIQKKVVLHAPLKRVWSALANSKEFGTWFGMKFANPFAPGAVMRGVIIPTKVNVDVAKAQQKYEGMPVEITIEKMEPERLFSFRWHPYAIERDVDYSAEPTTLIEFVLGEMKDGVMLMVTESGFDQIPLARRVKAFTANEEGWGMVVKLVEEYFVGAK